MSDFKYDKDQILGKTNGGLDVIKYLYPNEKLFSGGSEKKPKHFKVGFIHEETESVIIVPATLGSDCVIVKAFKDGSTYSCFDLVMQEHGLEFGEACKWIAENLNLTLDGFTARKGEFKFIDAEPGAEVGTFIDHNEKITEAEFKVLGPLVSEKEAEIFNLRSAKRIIKVVEYKNHPKHGTCKKQLITEATPDYPIFFYDYGKWQKIYQPFGKSKDQNGKTVDRRFSYAGTKPENFVFGLESLEDYYHDEWKLDNYDEENERYHKFKTVILVVGDRDGLNVSSMGFPVIWLNSETAKLQWGDYQRLLEIAENVCYCGDLDETGVKQTIKLALDYTDIKIIWLPDWIRNVQNGKDVTDFAKQAFNRYGEGSLVTQFRKLVYTALPARFWDEKKRKKDGVITGYDFNNEALVKFLNYNGFYRYEDANSKEDYEFVRVVNGVYERIKPHQITNFPLEWAQDKHLPISLRNAIHRTPQISDKRFTKLDKIEPDFTNSDRDYQRLFFDNKVIHIGKEEITQTNYKSNKANVWKDAIIPHNIQLAKTKNFKIFKNDKGEWDIDILTENNHFLNYLINTSRIHWRVCGNDPFQAEIRAIKEKELDLIEENKLVTQVLENRKKYREENKFNIAEEGLKLEQIAEQKLSLINKIFAWGYLLHDKKLDDKAWAVFAMDNRVSEIGESNGGSGKSIMFDKAIKYIVKQYKYINGGNKKLIESDFLFDGVTANTNYVIFDDLDSRFPFRSVYTNVTGEFVVNPKGKTHFNLLFHESPKIAFTSNFGLFSPDDSTLRRLLIVPFSDYYHYKGDNNFENYSPKDDFGKNLFTEFNDQENTDFFNLAFEAIQFFLNTEEKIEAPTENVDKRNALQTIGTDFKEWADNYFILEKNLNEVIAKKTALENCNKRVQKSLSSHFFKKRLSEWCKFHGFDYCPPTKEATTQRLANGSERLMKNIDGETLEVIFIKDAKKYQESKDLKTQIENDLEEGLDDIPY
ncbi:primase-helicase family protein [Mesonia mobilis]|uniref:primase-helicase family protein n=2 Tax=Mesonia mobilis TaxID=369791 RepID=UPI0026E99C65|nr:primase-helicase family protein [Mesonia mobilis]